MKQTKNKILAALVICAISASFAACSKTDNSSVTTIVNNDSQNASVTDADLPEKDSDGNVISMMQVTDAAGKPVTGADGAAVTEPVILDKNGKVVTDVKGSAVAPNLGQKQNTTSAVTSKTAEVTTSKNSSNESKPEGSTVQGGNGPAVYLYSKDGNSSVKAKPGDEITVKLTALEHPGYTALLSWIDINTDIFELVGAPVSGDPDLANYAKSPAKANVAFMDLEKFKTPDKYTANENVAENYKTIVSLYYDPSLEKITEKMTLATLTFRIKDSVAPGEYTLGFDPVQDKGLTQCNTIGDNQETVKLTPTFHDLKVVVE